MPRRIPQCRWIPLSVLTALAGCTTTPAATMTPPVPTTRPTAAMPQVFDSTAAGIHLAFPAAWTARPATGSTVFKAAAPPAADGGSATLTLDVPTLPAHIPGFLPIGLIVNGYVEDVKKRLPDATGTPREVTVADATARRVTLAGHDAAGRPSTDDAVLMVHADRVYILSADSDPAGRAAATAALDAAVGSIRWLP